MLSLDRSEASIRGRWANLGGSPAEGRVELDVPGRAGQPLLSPHYVADLHQVVVRDVGQVVSGEAVGLEHHEVVGQAVLKRDLPPDQVVDFGDALEGHLEPHDGRRTGRIQVAPLRLGEAPAAPVVPRRLLSAGPLLPRRGQPFLGAVAAIGAPGLHQAPGLTAVDVESLGLVVGAVRASRLGPFVPVQSQPAEGVQQLFCGAIHLAGLVGVLYSDNERAAVPPGKQPVEDRGAYVPDMRLAGWAGRKPDTHVAHRGTPNGFESCSVTGAAPSPPPCRQQAVSGPDARVCRSSSRPRARR